MRGLRLSPEELAELQRRIGQREPTEAPPPRRKYGNKPTEYRGIRYDSKAEAAVAAELDLRVTAGELVSWERQVLVRVHWPGGPRLLSSRLDFRLTWADGRQTYLEVKGYRVRDWALRERVLRASGLDLEVRTKGKGAAAGRRRRPPREPR